MAYIGNIPTDNFVTFATQNFSTSATSSYTLDHAVSNENEIALFINNVRQHPGSGKAYTATGTALTLSENTASTDVMYCIFLGRAIQSTVPSTNSITAAMVSNDLISGKTALASEPADTDEFLVSDAGVLKRIDYSLIKPSGSLTKISTTTISSAASSTLDVFTSTYRNYRIIGSGFTPATDDVELRIELYQADDTEAANYYWSGFAINEAGSDNGTTVTQGGTNEGTFRIFQGADTGGDASQVNFDMMVYQPQIAADTTISVQSAGRVDPTRGSVQLYGGFGGSTAVMTKIKFSFSSGNIANGVITVYGLEN